MDSKRTASGQQVDTNNNDKNNKEYKRSKKPLAISFEQSQIFDKFKFKEYFPDWSKEKLAHYYDAALRYSVEGNKYVSWELAIKSWKRKDKNNKVNIEPTKEARPYPMGLM